MSQHPSSPSQNTWKKCSSCKKEIPFGASIYLCSVSTCKHKRTGFRFCSVNCWDAHLGFARHRSAFAEESKAPTREEFEAEESAEHNSMAREPVKKVINALPTTSNLTAATSNQSSSTPPKTDTLVVVSKVKQLVREQSEFNTSECFINALTRKVVDECLKAIEHARKTGRKTVMGRDVL